MFDAADDPLRALRWNLSEVRRLLGPNGLIEGNPVTLTLPGDVAIDVHRILAGHSDEALTAASRSGELLDGFDGVGTSEFDLWLLAQRRRVAASTEAVLEEAVLVMLGKGEYESAIRLSQNLVTMSPYVEAHHALLIRGHCLAGDTEAAHKQFLASTKLFVDDLGVNPGPAIQSAMLAKPLPAGGGATPAAVNAVIEAGSAAMSAGAADAGVMSLRSAVSLADSLGTSELRTTSRIALADALVHAVRGEDDEGAVVLHEAERIASESGFEDLAAQARVELGFIAMLGARYDRAELWLRTAMGSTEDASLVAKALGYMGVVATDKAQYDSADRLLAEAMTVANRSGERRPQAYASSMLGRRHLLRGDLPSAINELELAIDLGQSENWLAFLPWPQAMLGEAMLESGDVESAEQVLEQAFARACQIGDPCWEGVTGRGLALLAEVKGDHDQAFQILADAKKRCTRLADTYRWAEAYILDAQCALGVTHGNRATPEWIEDLYDLSSRTGMRELTVRALVHRYRSGFELDLADIANVAAEITNPRLHNMLESL